MYIILTQTISIQTICNINNNIISNNNITLNTNIIINSNGILIHNNKNKNINTQSSTTIQNM